MRLQQLQQQREQELRLQQQQQEQELRLNMQQQEDDLRLRQHERALENETRKAEADKEQRRLKFELTKGSSRASGSVAEEIESVGSRRNQEKTAGWAESVAQQSVPRRPLSPNVVIDPPTNVTQGRVDKRFSTYTKTTPLLQPGEGLFSTQLTEPSILNKPEIRKLIKVTDPQAPPLKKQRFSCRERQQFKTETGCDISVPLRFLSSRNIWSADPDINKTQPATMPSKSPTDVGRQMIGRRVVNSRR